MGWADRVSVALLLAGAGVLLAGLRRAMGLPFWYNEQWRAWHISRPGGELWRQFPSADSPIAAGWLLVEKAVVATFGEVEAAYRWPVALCLPLLALTTYALARRWLGPPGSLVTAAMVLANPLLYGYAWQLAPYLCEAALAPLVVLAYLAATDWECRPVRRLGAYAAMGLCAVLGTALTFVVVPLLALDLARSLRARAWRRLAAPLLAGLVVGGHLAGVVLPQSKGAVTGYWVGSYAPWSPAMPGFLLRRLKEFVPAVVTGSGLGDWALAVLLWLALAIGAVAAARDRRVRPLLVALAGALALQLVASSLRLWAFGFLRINYFLIPLVYLLAAVGLAVPLRAFGRAWRGATRAAARRLAAAGLVAVLAAGAAGVVDAGIRSAAGLRDATRQSRSAHPYDGIRALVAAARQHAGNGDVVVFAQYGAYKSFKGWAYYMATYDGWPPAVARRPAVALERSVQVDDDTGAVRRFLTAHPEAPQVLAVTMANAQPGTVEAVARALRDADFQPGWHLDVQPTGTLTVWTPLP